MKPANFQQNQQIAGYHLGERIGSGGMGDVYKAYHSTLNRTAAIKFLHQKEFAERFKNEAFIQSTVNHPNIARLYEYFISGDTPCIIMEYVEGESLDTYLHRKGRLTSDETENIISQIASALTYLHEKDILHRDIKPQNFKIQSDGRIKMLDFGISKHKFTPKLTQEGFVVGTTEYMAPEQFEQQPEKKSDIWSLGVLTYELLTGYMPFEANNPITLRSKISKAVFTDPKILVPQISEKLAVIIEKSLRVNPVGRMTAAEITSLLSGKRKPVPDACERPEKKFALASQLKSLIPKIKIPERSKLILPAVILAGIILITILFVSIDTNKTEIVLPANNKPKPVNNKENTDPLVKTRKRKINVPGIENAVLVFPDGKTVAAPYEISGTDGEHIEFTIRADGYSDKKVQFDMGMGPYTYDFVLEKINK